MKHGRADKVVHEGDSVTVYLADGQQVVGSHVLMTVGSVPNTQTLGLDETGVETDRVATSRSTGSLRTSVPGVIRGRRLHRALPARVGGRHGAIAMYHALGEV